jgi:hypothetical protein
VRGIAFTASIVLAGLIAASCGASTVHGGLSAVNACLVRKGLLVLPAAKSALAREKRPSYASAWEVAAERSPGFKFPGGKTIPTAPNELAVLYVLASSKAAKAFAIADRRYLLRPGQDGTPSAYSLFLRTRITGSAGDIAWVRIGSPWSKVSLVAQCVSAAAH